MTEHIVSDPIFAIVVILLLASGFGIYGPRGGFVIMFIGMLFWVLLGNAK